MRLERLDDTLKTVGDMVCGSGERHETPVRKFHLDQIPEAVRYSLNTEEVERSILRDGEDVMVPVHRVARTVL